MNSIDSGLYKMNVLRMMLAFFTVVTGAGCVVVEPQVHAVIVNDRVVGEASASVELERAGVRSPVAPGAPLEVGDIVRTGENATAVLFLENGAVEVIVLENTEIRISSLWVELGEIFVKVKRTLRETFEVESEYGVAAVEGTVFSVRVQDGSQSPQVYECTTLEGRVLVSSRTNEWRALRLESGRSAVVNQGSPATRRILKRSEFNDLADRINRVERTFRPGSTELVAPDLVGLTLAEARQQASARGVKVGEPVPTVTGTVSAGQIAVQAPVAGGRLRHGASIRISIEVEPAIVPDLAGDTVATARRKLSAVNLQAGSVTEKPVLSGTFDRIIEQSEPPKAKVVPDTRIDLVVAVRGASVPSLKGTTSRTMRTRLKDAGLVLGSTSRRQGKDTPGVVVDQNPASGKIVEQGSRVDIVIEQGCTVPRVIGLSEEEAFKRIRSAGFTPNTRSVGRYNKDTVSGQAPAENKTTERCGTTFQIDLGSNFG